MCVGFYRKQQVRHPPLFGIIYGYVIYFLFFFYIAWLLLFLSLLWTILVLSDSGLTEQEVFLGTFKLDGHIFPFFSVLHVLLLVAFFVL